MVIARDLSDLPAAQGLTPDAEPRFIQCLVEKWAAENDDDKATALGTPFRHSDAGKCARAIAYTAAGIPKSDPMDITGVWNVTLGTLLHELWQEALQERWPDAEIEVKCRTQGADGSGHIDAVIRQDRVYPERPYTIAYELKSSGGYAYKAAVGARQKGALAEGPKSEHLRQSALNGLAVDADEIVIGYLAKEVISTNVAKRFAITNDLTRFCAEWTFTREQYEPIALEEAARIKGILALVADGQLAARKIPDLPPGAEITDPSVGAWAQNTRDDDGNLIATNTGAYWGCDYCGFQTLCATTEAGRIPIESVVSIGDAA